MKMGALQNRAVVCVFVLLSARGAYGQAPCYLSDVPLQQDFDLAKFVGKWFEIEWISATYQDSGLQWINYYHEYLADENGIVTGYYSGKDPNSDKCFYGGLANLKTTAHPAKLLQYSAGNKQLIDYWIISTDYESFAIAYSCLHRDTTRNDTCKTARSWVWSRSRSLPEDIKATARTTFEKLCMNMTLILTTGWQGEDCVPDYATGSAVRAYTNKTIAALFYLHAVILFFFKKVF